MIDGHVATDTRGEDTERKDTDIYYSIQNNFKCGSISLAGTLAMMIGGGGG